MKLVRVESKERQKPENQKILSFPTLSLHPWYLGGGTPYNGLCRDAPLERGTFFRLQVYKGVRTSQVEVYESVVRSPS